MSGKQEQQYTEQFEARQSRQTRDLLRFFGTIIATGFTVIALAGLSTAFI